MPIIMSDETLSDETLSDDPNHQAPMPRDLSQADAIAMVQQSIQQLDRVLVQINRPAALLPPLETLENLAHTTDLLAQALAIAPLSATTDSEALEELDESPTGLDQVLPDLDHLDNWWDRLLDRIRFILPQAIGEKLSDWALTSILAGLLVVSLVTSVVLLPRTPSEMKELPPLNQPQSKPLPQFSAPAEPANGFSAELPPERPAEPTVEPLVNPPELVAPNEPESIPVEPVPPKYTPEQSLIAAIQQELNTLTQRDASGLIQSIQADFLASHLVVTVKDDWYDLKPARQESLGNEVWLRSQKLDFRKLDMIDSQGRLVARNPVVGNAIVILR